MDKSVKDLYQFNILKRLYKPVFHFKSTTYDKFSPLTVALASGRWGFGVRQVRPGRPATEVAVRQVRLDGTAPPAFVGLPALSGKCGH